MSESGLFAGPVAVGKDKASMRVSFIILNAVVKGMRVARDVHQVNGPYNASDRTRTTLWLRLVFNK